VSLAAGRTTGSTKRKKQHAGQPPERRTSPMDTNPPHRMPRHQSQPSHPPSTNGHPSGRFMPTWIGGFSITSGRVWRWEIPPEHLGKFSLTLLEYLASITTIAIDAKAGNIPPDSCILSQLDSSTADYWLHRGGARFQGPEKATHLAISRWLAAILESTQSCSYSQWIPGADNTIADSISRDHHILTPSLTQLLHSSATTQMPPNFISQIPSDFVSKLTSWMPPGCCAPKDFKLRPKPSSIASYAYEKNFSPRSDFVMSPTTHSLPH